MLDDRLAELFMPAADVFVGAPGARAAVAAAELLAARVSAERQGYGLPALRPLDALLTAAGVRLAEIEQQFSHDRPSGATLDDLLEQVGVLPNVAGENLARIGAVSPSRAADRTMRGFMASPGHRANILDPSFRYVGIRAVERDGDGFFARWYVVQVFAG